MEHIEDFCLLSFCFTLYTILFLCRIFNTNNLWMKLGAIHRLVKERALSMEIIVNRKVSLAAI